MHFIGNTQGIASGTNYNRTAVNLFQPFANGSSIQSVIGNEITVRYVEIRYRLFHSSSSANDVASPVFVRFTVVKTPQIWQLASSVAPYIPEANIPLSAVILSGSNMPIITSKFNGGAVKVLWQKSVRLYGPPFGGFNQKIGKVKPKGYKGKRTFMVQHPSDVTFANGNIRQGQTYLVIDMYTSGNASATNNITMYYDWSMYYKDM